MYLDPQGLVALWREALLAQAVLRGETKGYRNHPQLARFKAHPFPQAALSHYLAAVHAESRTRGYSFDATKIHAPVNDAALTVTTGQRHFEWAHLMRKLETRNPELHERWKDTGVPRLHPMFTAQAGGIEAWERP